MRLSHAAAVLTLVFSPLALFAQAKLSCVVQPTDLAEMQGCYRPLLVFSPSDNDPRLKRQEQILDSDADDMMDRFVLLVPIVPNAKNTPTPLDAPYVVLSQLQMNFIRRRFHAPVDRFQTMLLIEDGAPKLRSDQPIPSSRLNAFIDTLPNRKRERLRRGAN